jgi:hypothetical protein
MFSLNEQVRFKSSGLWAIAIAPPSAPTITSVSPNNVQILVAFTAPISLNGSTITGYTVTSSGGQTATGTSSPIVLTGFTNGTSYTFTVVANSSNGNSGASVVSSSYRLLPAIGSAYGGGYFAGQINNNGTIYNLVVSPKASGESLSKAWGPYGSSGNYYARTGINSLTDGYTNTVSLNNLGASYAAGTFCRGLSIGGYNDWYLPAAYELQTLYYYLKPSTDDNAVDGNRYGSNPAAVSPQPVSTDYTSSSPYQTSATIFQVGGSECFEAIYGSRLPYWASTEGDNTGAWAYWFNNGSGSNGYGKIGNYFVRAVRRVLA